MHIHVVIEDEDLVRAFRRVALLKFKKLNGALTLAIEEAMRDWLARNLPSTHTNSVHKLPGGLTGRRLYEILVRLHDMYDGVDGKVKIAKNLVHKIIQAKAGMDPRTINKYLKLIMEREIIENVPGDKDFYSLDLDMLRFILNEIGGDAG